MLSRRREVSINDSDPFFSDPFIPSLSHFVGEGL